MSPHDNQVSDLSALLLAARSDQRLMDAVLLLPSSDKLYGQVKKTTVPPVGWLSRLSGFVYEKYANVDWYLVGKVVVGVIVIAGVVYTVYIYWPCISSGLAACRSFVGRLAGKTDSITAPVQNICDATDRIGAPVQNTGHAVGLRLDGSSAAYSDSNTYDIKGGSAAFAEVMGESALGNQNDFVTVEAVYQNIGNAADKIGLTASPVQSTGEAVGISISGRSTVFSHGNTYNIKGRIATFVKMTGESTFTNQNDAVTVEAK